MTDILASRINEKGTKMPIRVQRKRTRGWRMPANTVYVGRSTPWGNGYTFTGDDGNNCGTREEAVRQFAKNIRGWKRIVGKAVYEEWIAPLRGKNLACWCALDKVCHADVLLEWAND